MMSLAYTDGAGLRELAAYKQNMHMQVPNQQVTPLSWVNAKLSMVPTDQNYIEYKQIIEAAPARCDPAFLVQPNLTLAPMPAIAVAQPLGQPY